MLYSTLQPHGCSRMFWNGHCKKGLFTHQEFVTEIGFLGSRVVLATMFLRLQTRKTEEKVANPYIHMDGGGSGEWEMGRENANPHLHQEKSVLGPLNC